MEDAGKIHVGVAVKNFTIYFSFQIKQAVIGKNFRLISVLRQIFNEFFAQTFYTFIF